MRIYVSNLRHFLDQLQPQNRETENLDNFKELEKLLLPISVLCIIDPTAVL